MIAAVTKRVKLYVEFGSAALALGGVILWLTLPRINAHTDGRAEAVVAKADVPVVASVSAVAKSISDVAANAERASQEAGSANALAQSQAELLGAMACLQVWGTVVGNACAIKVKGSAVPTLVPLKSTQGLVAAMAVRGR